MADFQLFFFQACSFFIYLNNYMYVDSSYINRVLLESYLKKAEKRVVESM